MKKVLLGTAVAAMLAGTAHAESGAYVGLGFGKAFANSKNKISGTGNDGLGDSVPAGFGERKLKDKSAITGKFFGGYEFDLSNIVFLTEFGFALDDAEAKYDKDLTITEAEDDDGNAPKITSTTLKRNRTFSLGLGVRKQLVNNFSVLGGVDLLHSQFEVKNKASGNFAAGVNNVNKKKSKFGVGPWIGAAWDLGMVQAGLRYQYSRYQTLKTSGNFVSGDIAVSNKVKPEFHTVMVTVSKKF